MRSPRFVALLLLAAGCVKTERDYQLEHARSLTPKRLGQASVPAGTAPPIAEQPPRVFTVRAFVDLDYQAQVLHWNERILSQLTQASRQTKAALNVELKLVSIESWDQHSEHAPLQAHLRALEKEDQGNDVDLVLGFVSSLQVFTESQEQLGLARIAGRHAVLRAMDNGEEHQAITRVFTRLDVNEREALYRERKLHKEVAVLLHEWAHALGAPHDLVTDSLLNPIYGISRSRFPPMSAALLARALELRDAKSDRKATAKELAAFIRAAPEGSWSLADLQGTLDDLEQVMRGEDARAVAASNKQDRAVFEEVRRLEARGQHAEALRALEPLLQREPPLTEAHSLACQLSGVISLSTPETLTRCRKACQLAPTDGPALLMLAQAQTAAKDLVTARETFVTARGLLLARSPVPMETSAALGAVARMLGYVTWAEESSGRAPGRASAEQVLEWAAKKRRWFGLPAGGVAAEAEPEYLERFVQAQNELGANQLPRAEATTASLEKSFPSLPGPLTLRCELWFRRRVPGKARAACEQALAAYPDSLQAHYLLGVMASLSGQHQKAIGHLEAVVAGDPTVDDAWQRLASAYGAVGDKKNRDRALKRAPLE